MKSLPFVGRGRESAFLRAELEAGHSVVLSGTYGIGRTSLARHLADEMTEDWLFAFGDFGRGPGSVWRELFATIFPRAQARLRHETKPVQWTRYRVLHKDLEDRRRHVAVIDNVARLSARGLDMMRRLHERFQVVAIAEAFLPARATSALCAALWTRRPMRLGPVGPGSTVAFLEQSSRRHGFGWGPGEVQGLARALAGFPLGMHEAVAAELRRREASERHQGLSSSVR